MTTLEPAPTLDEFDVSKIIRTDRVHGSVYTSADIFRREMDSSFKTGWVYVAHESEVPQALRAILVRGMAKDREKRFLVGTAEDDGHDLRDEHHRSQRIRDQMKHGRSTNPQRHKLPSFVILRDRHVLILVHAGFRRVLRLKYTASPGSAETRR